MANEKVSAMDEETNPNIGSSFLYMATWNGSSYDSRKVKSNNALALGYGRYADATYTSSSKLTINSTEAKITIDGAGSETVTSELPSGITNLWNSTANKVVGENSNDLYEIQFMCKAESGSSNAYCDLNFKVNSVTKFSETLVLAKGTSEHKFDVPFKINITSDFVTNGGEFHIDTSPGGYSIDFWDFDVIISRVYASQ